MRLHLSSLKNRLAEEPYRVFFPLGALAGIFGVSHWLLYAAGSLKEYSPVFHSSVQMQLYIPLFICGFLMTAGPRFSGSFPAKPAEVGVFLLLFAGIFLSLIFHLWILSDLLFCALLFTLASFLFRRFRASRYRPPTEFAWIPIGIFCGLLGGILSMLSYSGVLQAQWLVTGKVLKEQGFVLSIVLGVGGFLGPRLLGFSGILSPSELRSMADAQKARQKRVVLHAVAGACLLGTFFLEGAGRMRTAYVLRAAVVSAEILWTTRIFLRPVARELFAWLLWHSLWLVVLGYWAAAFWPAQRKAMLHIVFIGGFSLMIFAVATMVIFSHAGEPQKLKKPSWILRIAAGSVSAAFLLRIAAVFFPLYYFSFLGVAAAFWIIAGVFWLYLAAPRLMRHAETGPDRC